MFQVSTIESLALLSIESRSMVYFALSQSAHNMLHINEWNIRIVCYTTWGDREKDMKNNIFRIVDDNSDIVWLELVLFMCWMLFALIADDNKCFRHAKVCCAFYPLLSVIITKLPILSFCSTWFFFSLSFISTNDPIEYGKKARLLKWVLQCFHTSDDICYFMPITTKGMASNLHIFAARK